MEYKIPKLTYLVLDFLKPEETRLCLESIKRHTKFDHYVIYLHNGPADYPQQFLKEGLCDQLIQTKENNGLGIGTRDLFASCFTEYAFYLQNDQFLFRDFTLMEFQYLVDCLNKENNVVSITLSGIPCGQNIYSERGHLIKTDFYKWMEQKLPLKHYGAGPWHDGEWRESQIQNFYKQNNLIHQEARPLVMDNGRRAIRQNPDGSLWEHFPDTKALKLLKGPIKERFIYPKFSDREWENVLKTQQWPAGAIPELEVNDSFHVWN